MYNFIQNNQGKISFKLFISGLVVLILFLSFGFLFLNNGPNKNYLTAINIPVKYNQPLIIKTLNTFLSINPVNAQAVEMVSAGKNVIKYEEAYLNTDVIQTRYTNKLKEDIILKQAGHPEKFVYQINIEAFDFSKDGQGNLIFYLKDRPRELGKIFTIPAPFMVEHTNTDANIYEYHTNDIDKGYVKMEINNGKLILTPDKEWIENHNYPIILDPTVEINILNVQSHPQQGEYWEVEFTTQGRADLKIIPDDQATIDEDEFVSLSCEGKERNPEILTGDIIYYPNWQCNGIGKVVHYTLIGGKHTLKFDFGGEIAYAHNNQTLDPWWNVDWTHRRQITFNTTNSATSTALINYPASIRLNSSRIDYAKIDEDYGDLRFIDADNATELYFEMEEYNESATSTIWVQVPNIAANSSTDHIWMYYNNPGVATSTYASTTAVWDDNYVGVWHASSSTIFLDSTKYHNNGTLTNTAATTTDHTMGKALDYNLNACATIANSPTLNFTGNISIEAWSSSDTFEPVWSYVRTIAHKGFDNTDEPWALNHSNNSGPLRLSAGSYNSGSGSHGAYWEPITYALDTLYYDAGTYDGTQWNIYSNGLSKGTKVDAVGALDSTYAVYLGCSNLGGSITRYLDGVIDEVRISNIGRTDDWVAFTYCNFTDTCASYGTEEEVITNVTPTISSVTDYPEAIGVGAKLNFSVNWADDDQPNEMAWMTICKGSGITTSTATCKDGTWTSSQVFTNRDPEIVTYTTAADDAGAQNYWAFVCDDEYACSAGTAGTFTVANQRPDEPLTLLVEGMEVGNAINITDTTPEFSAVYKDTNDEGDVAEEYCIEVDTQADFAGTDMWISDAASCYAGSAVTANIPESKRSEGFAYAGTALTIGGATYYWRMWFWDGGERSATSTTGWFTMADTSSGGGVRVKGSTLKGGVRLK